MVLAGELCGLLAWCNTRLSPGQGLPSLFLEDAGAFLAKTLFAGEHRQQLCKPAKPVHQELKPRSLPSVLKAQKKICRVSASLEKWELALVLQRVLRKGSSAEGAGICHVPAAVVPCGWKVPLVRPGHCHPCSSSANLPEHLYGTSLFFA